MSETFGQRLSRLRKEKGLTQEDIAKRIIISPQAVSKWENDISSPDILVLCALADILGVSVDELLGREAGNEETKEGESEKVEAEVVDDDEKISEENEHEHTEGIHIVDDEGNRVDIDDSGVHVTKEGKTKKVTINKTEKKEYWITTATLFGLALVGYLMMGIFWTDKNMGWSMGWILFLLPIIVGSILTAIRHKRITMFAYPFLVVAAYCTLGFLGSYYGFEGWGFYWFLFITIPAFYLIFGPVDHYIHRFDPKEDDDDDDD